MDKTYSVGTFTYPGAELEMVDGTLTFGEALKLAEKLLENHFGVEVVDNGPDNMEPIVWCKCNEFQ